MSYITNIDIERRLGTAAYVQLTDDAGSGGADAARVDEARLGAIGEADSYLAPRYRTPVDLSAFPEPAAVLKSFVLDLAEYRLHNRRPPVPPDVVRRHAEALTWLQRVAGGLVLLPAAAALPGSVASPAPAALKGAPRVFLRDDRAQQR